ncbi:TetR/AcrR family transcriptional regulator [Blastococcus brunescens]|uniref:TetR/AcrR family transcriptional regulator n=1 Tax=Blastococcus brunescens TaxID=1564165 RepID=A0ABZ1AXU7_9ACTN|nr:TetR/AcrR family transcriptional regulator [Blastococcus sp. BMG 8361]WRL63388.1 TetR/AcrR family transcriptional regulator [Blastococcus sp. BMG 8361]
MVATPFASGGSEGPRRDSRRADILDAFTRAVAERGYDGTNFGDLALELGISKGTIVHHFGTKDRMLRELHESYMRRRLAEVRVVWERLTGPAERLAAFVHLGVRYQVVDRAATVAFQREVLRFAAEPGMETSQSLRGEYRELVEQVLSEGTAAGSSGRVTTGCAPCSCSARCTGCGPGSTPKVPRRGGGGGVLRRHVPGGRADRPDGRGASRGPGRGGRPGGGGRGGRWADHGP